jgi:hypothetical protein
MSDHEFGKGGRHSGRRDVGTVPGHQDAMVREYAVTEHRTTTVTSGASDMG